MAVDQNARAVAVSISAVTRGSAMTAQIGRLRRRLPRRIALVVGGEGAARAQRGVETIRDLGALDAWACRLAAAV